MIMYSHAHKLVHVYTGTLILKVEHISCVINIILVDYRIDRNHGMKCFGDFLLSKIDTFLDSDFCSAEVSFFLIQHKNHTLQVKHFYNHNKFPTVYENTYTVTYFANKHIMLLCLSVEKFYVVLQINESLFQLYYCIQGMLIQVSHHLSEHCHVLSVSCLSLNLQTNMNKHT